MPEHLHTVTITGTPEDPKQPSAKAQAAIERENQENP